MVAVSRLNWSSYFPTLTFRSFLSHYLPASGALSHTLFAVHIFNPTFVSRIFTTKDLAVSNSILFTANLGLGFYMYYRRHLHRLKKWDRVELRYCTDLSCYSVLTFRQYRLLQSLEGYTDMQSTRPNASVTLTKRRKTLW
ncbi:unnamed protein product [Angiostrongylus costaricensis]|uniref:Uncharacterized protein n=1 Tax=Angiostrongylus costaricensis TaxID=334426 RepID=A0A0R3Q0H8_ANGCS|nr:unnamed protein product [Angiostrongylus costaricensis]